MDIKTHQIVGAWFGTCLISLIFSITFLIFISKPQLRQPSNTVYRLYSALPQNKTQIEQEIKTKDGRSLIVENFFNNHHSPLTDHSNLFITIADFYHLDFRLLPSIAMQESNGGKKVPNNSFNPFGYGIYGSKKVHFENWEDAIQTVGKSLREDYLDIGLRTPEQIMTKYTPPSLSKGGTWAKGVNHFMEELR